MLQQTQASAVAPYFERFVARFPALAELAEAPLDEVLHIWSGLGYYARARNLHRAAQIVACRHAGIVPGTQAELAALPGIGRSTAAAIVAQASDAPAAILDGNAKRVLARHFRVRGPISASSTLRTLWALAERHTPPDHGADYAQAMMDLGATVCVRARPRCSACPLSATCLARRHGEERELPQPAERRTRRHRQRRFFVLTDAAGACFVEHRPPAGVWGGLWSPPERPAATTPAAFLAAVGLDALPVARVDFAPTFRHVFTHFDLDVAPVYVHLGTAVAPATKLPGRWITPGAHRLGLSAVAAKLLAEASQRVLALARTVFCRKFQRELPGLAAPPLPGSAGADIYDNVSAQAWQAWQQLQTMLINERHLSLIDPEARKFLQTQMAKFLANEEHERPAGYVPPSPD